MILILRFKVKQAGLEVPHSGFKLSQFLCPNPKEISRSAQESIKKNYEILDIYVQIVGKQGIYEPYFLIKKVGTKYSGQVCQIFMSIPLIVSKIPNMVMVGIFFLWFSFKVSLTISNLIIDQQNPNKIKKTDIRKNFFFIQIIIFN